VWLAFSLIVVGNLVLNILQFLDVLPILDSAFAFITVDWLGNGSHLHDLVESPKVV
jgi:hypothetical protein